MQNIDAFSSNQIGQASQIIQNSFFEVLHTKDTTIKVTPHHGGQGYVTPTDINVVIKQHFEEDIWQKTNFLKEIGGSIIPIVYIV
jgi:hypothetical protein